MEAPWHKYLQRLTEHLDDVACTERDRIDFFLVTVSDFFGNRFTMPAQALGALYAGPGP